MVEQTRVGRSVGRDNKNNNSEFKGRSKRYLKKFLPVFTLAFDYRKSKCLRRYLNNICSLLEFSFIELN